MAERFYMCIDFKSFYASVECVERGLDPMTARLVVADVQRTSGTICLAVTPALKSMGVKNRCRIFEIPKHIDYIAAKPRMNLYIKYSSDIYKIYLRYFSKDDIQIYSIDEVFIDITDYLSLYKTDAINLAYNIITEIQETTGIPSACGIGTNLYLAKVALDITAKHAPNNIGFLDEERYQQTLWTHTPLTDFWRIGPGISNRLTKLGITNMREIALAAPEVLYKALGIDAEYLIDHAWGREPTTIKDIKNYKPEHSSMSNGQVLIREYTFDEALIIVKEMVDLLCLDLVDKNLVTDSIALHIGYKDHIIPSLNKSQRLQVATSSVALLTEHFVRLYRDGTSRTAPIKRITITFCHVFDELFEQYNLFLDTDFLKRERSLQKSINAIKKKYGKNAILKGINLLDCATTRQRNSQIGGHNADYE